MSGEPSLQTRRSLTGASAELKNEIVNTTSGYGGISEKISRLNDILKSLEARRNASTVISYDSPDITCPPIWPPTLYNSARLLETRAAVERSSTTRDTPHGMLNTLPRSHDGMLDTLPVHSTGGAVLDTLTRHHHANGGVLDMPTRKHHLRGGGMFDTLTRHQHVPRGHGVLSTLTQKHHAAELTRHQHTESSDLGVFDMLTRHHAREYGVLDTLMRRHHARLDRHHVEGGGVLDRHHVEGGGVLDTVNRHHASTPRASSLNLETDFYTPTYCPQLITASPTLRNHNYEVAHDYCHNYEPSQNGYFSASGDRHLEKQRAPSTEFLSHNKECTKSFLNVAEMAHEILARLERLEMQPTTSKRPKLQRPLPKKGAVRKVGGDRKLSRQERGLLQAVRRRCSESKEWDTPCMRGTSLWQKWG